MRRIAVVAFAFLAVSAAPAATSPVRATSLPRAAIVGAAWQVVLRAAAPPTVVAAGPGALRARARGARGVFRATLRFPSAGTWRISALLGGRTTRLGAVTVAVARDPLLVAPFAIAVDASGGILVGQMDKGPLVR